MSYEFNIDFDSSCSKVTIKPYLLDELAVLIKKHYAGKKIMVVSDEKVYSIYGPKLEMQIKESGAERALLILPFGETCKTQESLSAIYRKLLEHRFTRDDVVLSFGGGAVGDVTGMAASTYLRGLTLVNLPTTLVAQSDSSIGGKNGINLPEGKNLLGTFYQPENIWIDPIFLKTLDKKYIRSGIAEIIKYATISDESFFNELLALDDELEELTQMSIMENIIYKCCMIKKSFIEDDETEQGKRILLNFGHTIGHGIEKYYDYKNFSHGEAVSIGMNVITEKSEVFGHTRINTSEILKEISKKYNLPYEIPDTLDPQRLFDMMYHDKKHSGEDINLVILDKIGSPKVHKIKHDQLMEYLT